MSDDYSRSLQNLSRRVEGVERQETERTSQRDGEIREFRHTMNNVLQSMAIIGNDKRYADERAARLEARIAELSKKIDDRFEHLEKTMVPKERYQNVERIVYGLTGILLTAIGLQLASMFTR